MKPSDWASADDSVIGIAVADAAYEDIGQMENMENGRGNNRGTFPDRVNRRTGSPLGSPWCANACAWWADKAGAWRPAQRAGSVDEWVREAKRRGLWRTSGPRIGDFIVYTNGRRITRGRYAGQLDANHMGVIGRIKPLLRSVEGNTSLVRHNRDGLGVAEKSPDMRRVYGYIRAVWKEDA